MHIGFFDGSSNPNPGQLGLGICIYANGKEVLCGAKPSGFGTNNEAEYKALIWLLEECLQHGIKHITCYGDSQLIVRQVNGQWSSGKDELIQLLDCTKTLIRQFESFDLIWIRREKNRRADALSKRGAELKEAKIHVNSDAPTHSKVVSLADHGHQKSLVMPLMNNELVIIENNRNYYLNTQTRHCSCPAFTETARCRHIDALVKALKTRTA